MQNTYESFGSKTAALTMNAGKYMCLKCKFRILDFQKHQAHILHLTWHLYQLNLNKTELGKHQQGKGTSHGQSSVQSF